MPLKRNVSKPYIDADNVNLMVHKKGETIGPKDRQNASTFLKKMGMMKKKTKKRVSEALITQPMIDKMYKLGSLATAQGDEEDDEVESITIEPDFEAPELEDPRDFRAAVVEPMAALHGLAPSVVQTVVSTQAKFTPTMPMRIRPDSSDLIGQAIARMKQDYLGHEYGELAVLLSALRATNWIHQSAHWQASSDPFYGDHMLYQRLYEATAEHVDKIAERLVGLADGTLVDPHCQAAHLCEIMTWCCDPGSIHASSIALAERSMLAERALVESIEYISDNLKVDGLLTKGLDNLLAQLSDDHESHIYLLKQRMKS